MNAAVRSNVWRSLSASLIVVSLGGCVGTKAGAHQVFAEDVSRLVGHSYGDATRFFGAYLKEQKAIKTTRLENGNELRTHFYARTSSRWSSEIEPCAVVTEVDPSEHVVAARAEGEGCWRPY